MTISKCTQLRCSNCKAESHSTDLAFASCVYIRKDKRDKIIRNKHKTFTCSCNRRNRRTNDNNMTCTIKAPYMPLKCPFFGERLKNYANIYEINMRTNEGVKTTFVCFNTEQE